MSSVKRWIAIAALALSAAAYAQAENLGPAPAFSLQTLDGKTITLASLKGKAVFIDFFATWCPPCRQSIPAVEAFYQKHKNENVAFIGVAMEKDRASVRKFASKMGITYPVVLGNNQAAQEYRVVSIPTFILIDSEGNMVQRHVGFSPGMAATWEQELASALPKKSTPSPKKSK